MLTDRDDLLRVRERRKTITDRVDRRPDDGFDLEDGLRVRGIVARDGDGLVTELLNRVVSVESTSLIHLA